MESDEAKRLAEIFRNGPPRERSRAADRFAFLILDNPESVKPALSDKDASVRFWAITAIGRAQDSSFAFDLARMLCDRSARVRDASFAVLRDLLDDETLMQIIGKVANEAPPNLRKRIKPYSDLVLARVQLIMVGFSEQDLAELRKKGFVRVERPGRAVQARDRLLLN